MGPGGSGGPPGGPPGPPAPQTQPLASNVLGKGGDRTMDQQYMQQSSQIFVFSTEWANNSAHAVMNQEFPSIIAWHFNQPDTKKHLTEMRQKYPQLPNTIMDGPGPPMRFQMNKMMKGPKGQPMMPPGMRPM